MTRFRSWAALAPDSTPKRIRCSEGENPYELEIRLVDDLKPGDVAVFACGGPTDRIAPWGELLTTAAMARGAAGCVTDGLVRDVRHIRKMKFPVFHGGIGPLDSKGRSRMIEMDRPVVCAGVRVCVGRYCVRRRRRRRGHSAGDFGPGVRESATTRRRAKTARAKSSVRGACCRKSTQNMAFSEEPRLQRMRAKADELSGPSGILA